MKRSVLTAAAFTLLPLTGAIAADKGVPFNATAKPAADAALHDTLPEAIKKRGSIIAGTNPNTPPTTFYQADNKTLSLIHI